MNDGRDMDRREKMKTNYRKECTIVVEVGDNQKIAAGELINFLTQRFGDIIHACVPKGPDRFEITVDDLIQARIIADSEILELNGVRMKSRLLHSESVVVSFFTLASVYYRRRNRRTFEIVKCQTSVTNIQEIL